MIYWWAVISLIVAAIAGILGFFVLEDRRRGFAKVIFYIFLMAAVLFFIYSVSVN